MKTEDVKKIAMIGAGDMGHGIAACFLQAGYTVVLRDIEQKFVDKGVAGIKASFDKFKAKGKMTAGGLRRCAGAADSNGGYKRSGQGR